MTVSPVLAHEKLDRLKEYLQNLGSAAIAFSGGVDSTFLLAVAHEVLGEKAAAITAISSVISVREKNEAETFCQEKGIRQIICRLDVLGIPGFTENPPDRCYICKKEIFSNLQRIAAENGFSCVAEGSNMDDTGDYRPGMRAIAELAVKSPLRDCELYKDEIRLLSREYGLPTWSKPSFACLASRFVYGETITPEKLARIDQAEEFLAKEGFSQYRVRIHGDLARIELPPEEMLRMSDEALRLRIHDGLKGLGFSYVTLDLKGYRTGSMNETLTSL